MRYVGIDIGKKKCQACVMGEDGTILDEFVFSNNSDGISLLLSRIGKDCRVAMESTANYWVRLYRALEENGIELN